MKKLTRAGWSGKYIELVGYNGNNGYCQGMESFLRLIDGVKRVPWVASNDDILSCDWYEVE